jgi:hypothetical protein
MEMRDKMGVEVSAMVPPADERLAWLVEHAAEVAERYAGRWVAVVNDRVAGTGNTAREAFEAAATLHGPAVQPLLSYVEATADVIYAVL